jgi:hypothetical protein
MKLAAGWAERVGVCAWDPPVAPTVARWRIPLAHEFRPRHTSPPSAFLLGIQEDPSAPSAERPHELISRDGADVLRQFFARYPAPIFERLWVTERAGRVVPSSWAANVGFHRLRAAPPAAAAARGTWVIGTLAPMLTAEAHLRELLRTAREWARPLFLFLPALFWGFGCETDPAYPARALRDIHAALGPDAQVVDRADLTAFLSRLDRYPAEAAGWSFMDLNDRGMIALGNREWDFLSRGVRPLHLPVAAPGDGPRVALSAFHELMLGVPPDTGEAGDPATIGRTPPWAEGWTVPRSAR